MQKRLSALFLGTRCFLLRSKKAAPTEILFKHSGRKHLLVCARGARASTLLGSLPEDACIRDLLAERAESASTVRQWLAEACDRDQNAFEAVLADLG